MRTASETAAPSAAAEASAGLSVGDLIPAFTASTAAGAVVKRHDYRGRRHLVLVFLHDPSCHACAALLRTLAADYVLAREESAEVLAFLPPDAAGDALPVVPYPLLHDTAALRARFGLPSVDGVPGTGLFVADRYGEVVLRAVAPGTVVQPLHGLPVGEVLPLLGLLQVRCNL